MINITLTDFVDFVATSGEPRLTKVRTIKKRGEYRPATDFWKGLREAIQTMHRENRSKAFLDETLTELTDQRKAEPYRRGIKGYKRFLGRKKIVFFDPPAKVWTHGKLRVRVNPELGLEVNGERYVIKLYFKKAPIAKRRVQCALHLMHSALPTGAQPYHVAIVDVSNGKLVGRREGGVDLAPLLRGEAIAFAEIWNALP